MCMHFCNMYLLLDMLCFHILVKQDFCFDSIACLCEGTCYYNSFHFTTVYAAVKMKRRLMWDLTAQPVYKLVLVCYF